MAGRKSQIGPDHFRSLLNAPDDVLLAQCDIDTYRASGPGGQKRNKTSSAVRLRLRNTDISAIGTESRSQHENKAKALRRLRERIAVEFRLPLAENVGWPEGVQIASGCLRVSRQNPALPRVVALVLDAWDACGGEASAAGEKLNVSASSLTRFVAAHPLAWSEAMRIRVARGLPTLRSP